MLIGMYAIAGVTGHVGSAAADALLAQGKQVRVIVRDAAKGAPWQAKGAEVAIATFDNIPALTAALTGATGAFLLVPPAEGMTSPDPIGHNVQIGKNLAAAIKVAKLPHVVLLSSIGAQLPDGTGPIKALHHVERELVATGAAVTAVRACFFQENWGMSFGALAQNILPTFVPKALAYPQVSTRDIGRTVAAALVEGGQPGLQVIELEGPREYNAFDVAELVSELTGKTVTATDAPLEAVVPTFTGLGVGAASAELYREMYAGIASGHIRYEGGMARHVKGSVEVGETLKALLGK
jgi:uncharacterized protein YbjT (DUF2867 family)